MKKMTVLLITMYHCGLFAGGFSFVPKKGIFDTEIETIRAKVKLSDNNIEYSCLVDTGARFTIFKNTILKDLIKVGETNGGGISNSNQATDLVNLTLNLGDWQIVNGTIGRTDRIPFDCLIGNDFFINKNFQIDFNNYKITDLDEPIELKNAFPLQVYRSEAGGHFGFEMTLAQEKVGAIFDTGASATVVSLDFARAYVEHFKFIKEINVTDGNSAEIRSGLYELDEISFANTKLKKIAVYVMDLSNLKSKIPNVGIVLGLNIIQNYNWQFDTKNSQFSYSSIK